MTRITEEIKQEMCRLRGSGNTYQQIADQTKFNLSRVYYALNPDSGGSKYKLTNWNSCKICGKKCHNEFCSKHNPGNGKSRIGYRKRYRENSSKSYRLAGLRYRAKKNGWEFSLTVDTLPEVPFNCPVPGCYIEFGLLSDTNFRTRPTLDRINSNKGYIPDNVHWLCDRHNRMKLDATSDEIINLGEYIRKVSNDQT